MTPLDHWKARALAAEADRDRLRRSLEEIRNTRLKASLKRLAYPSAVEQMHQIADSALSREQEGGGR